MQTIVFFSKISLLVKKDTGCSSWGRV